MRFDIVTLFPGFVESVRGFGVIGRAVEAGKLDIAGWNPRDYTRDRHRTVDDRPYGGGPGMVMKVEPLRDCVRAVKDKAPAGAPVIYLSPQGRPLTQSVVRRWADRDGLILVCGRYEGVDERFISLEVDEEWSIGDYVLSGGELPAMVVIDAVARLLPGVLGDADSADQDSFMDGLLDCPHYTRPESIDGLAVPDVLLGGDHAAIARWRRREALGRTRRRRPDLIEALELDEEDRRLLEEYQEQHRR